MWCSFSVTGKRSGVRRGRENVPKRKPPADLRKEVPEGSRSDSSLPSPTLRKRGHGALARRRIAVGGRTIFVMPEGQRPHPWLTNWRCVHLENAADHNAIGKYVIVIIVPFAGWARS